ncbi:uncharacterized protein BROUX77_003251 [Berkeleyomyces rouxiae]|uniref:uncharacterized protein n=1 Tax=Berkeleyomyces rouxiae TaxID=2035830 RepID=UPI003B77208B
MDTGPSPAVAASGPSAGAGQPTPASGATADSPIIYRNMFSKLPGEHPIAARQFCDLASALADYISSAIGDVRVSRLTPQKMADFYRLVSTGDSWDSFWLDTNTVVLSEILRTIGAFHSLEPTADPYEAPSVPALTREGFVRWLSLQILLSPEDNISYLQYAVQNFHLKHPTTGQRFPPNLPSVVFCKTPDPEVTTWHNRCGDKLKKRLEHQQKREKRERREAREKRPQEHRRESESKTKSAPEPKPADTTRLHPTTTPSGKTTDSTSKPSKGTKAYKEPTAEAADAKLAADQPRPHMRSTSASFPSERTAAGFAMDETQRRHMQKRMGSFDRVYPRHGREGFTHYAGPEVSSKFYRVPPQYHASTGAVPMFSYARDEAAGAAAYGQAPPAPDYSYPPTHAWAPPHILRHASAAPATPIHRPAFSPSSHESGGSFPLEMDKHHAGSPSTPSPRRRSHGPRAEYDHISPRSAPMGATPRIRVSMDTAASRSPPYIVSPPSPRAHYFGRAVEPTDDDNSEEVFIYTSSPNASPRSHPPVETKRRSGVHMLGSFWNVITSTGAEKAGVRERESERVRTRGREREWEREREWNKREREREKEREQEKHREWQDERERDRVRERERERERERDCEYRSRNRARNDPANPSPAHASSARRRTRDPEGLQFHLSGESDTSDDSESYTDDDDDDSTVKGNGFRHVTRNRRDKSGGRYETAQASSLRTPGLNVRKESGHPRRSKSHADVERERERLRQRTGGVYC